MTHPPPAPQHLEAVEALIPAIEVRARAAQTAEELAGLNENLVDLAATIKRDNESR